MSSIRTWYIEDEEDKRRLYENHPRLKESWVDYCPTCGTAGVYTFKGEEHECDCELQLQLYKHYLVSGIGVTYQRLDWVDFVGSDIIVEDVAKYVEGHERYIDRGVGLLFTGMYGTGKTMISNLVLKEFVKLKYSCFATTFSNAVEMFTAGWQNEEDRKYFGKKLVHSDVLLLDDLGREFQTKNNLGESTLDNILRERVKDGRPTFITANLDPNELAQKYSGAILSLLTEKSIHHDFTGEDFRPMANLREIEELKRGETRPIV